MQVGQVVQRHAPVPVQPLVGPVPQALLGNAALAPSPPEPSMCIFCRYFKPSSKETDSTRAIQGRRQDQACGQQSSCHVWSAQLKYMHTCRRLG